MSDALKYGGPAFPTEPRGSVYGNKHDGMTLRDWFAGQVIASVKAWHPADKRGKSAAAIAYEIADAMLAERQVIRPPRHLTVAADAVKVVADRIEELEAKLAKAVEALERIASGEFSGRMLTSRPPQDAAAYFARTTLAELKGDDPE